MLFTTNRFVANLLKHVSSQVDWFTPKSSHTSEASVKRQLSKLVITFSTESLVTKANINHF